MSINFRGQRGSNLSDTVLLDCRRGGVTRGRVRARTLARSDDVTGSRAPLEKRFWRHVSPEPNSGCWLWDGALSPWGYGVIGIGPQKTQCAHVVSWLIFRVQPIPDGYEVDHKCRVRSCVNPDHLEPVTHQENCRRGDQGKHLSQRTQCPRGHLYAGSNLQVYGGRRFCRECQNSRRRKN